MGLAKWLALGALALLASLALGARAQVNVLQNPGFESGAAGWTQSSSGGFALITGNRNDARSGTAFAWLGGGHNLDETLSQDVVVPAGARLQFWYRFSTNEPTDGSIFLNFDILEVELVDPDTGRVVELVDFFFSDNSNGWRQSDAYDVAEFAGRRLRLRFSVSTDREYTSSFRIDDVALTGTPVAATNNYTALWWNPAEPGWGINVTHQGDTAFATLFTYDAARAPLWLVMSGGARTPGTDTFSGDLYRTTGPAFNAAPFTPVGGANVTTVGRMTLAFTSAGAGTLTYSVNGANVTKPLQRQVFGSRAASCASTSSDRRAATNYQDLWWNPAESGWGINVAHQDNTLFATLFTYSANGLGNANPGMWLVMSGGARQADGSYLGDLFRTSGAPFSAAWSAATATPVGTLRLRFQDGQAGTLTYTVNGVSVTKAISRQPVASPVTVCTS